MRNGYSMYANRPYSAYPLLEASGAAAGHAQDASAGMARWIDNNQKTWAFNTSAGEWQRLHTIVTGDTLWKISGLYYSAPSLDGVHAIYGVPQNKAIQGSSPDKGLIPGDVILIPGLPQPALPPQGSDSPVGAFPDAPPPIAGVPTVPPGSGLPVPLPTTAPTDWPSDDQYPPVHVPSGGVVTLPTVNVEGTVPSTADWHQETPAGSTAKPKFWSTGRILAASAAGVAGVGLLAFLATRKRRAA